MKRSDLVFTNAGGSSFSLEAGLSELLKVGKEMSPLIEESLENPAISILRSSITLRLRVTALMSKFASRASSGSQTVIPSEIQLLMDLEPMCAFRGVLILRVCVPSSQVFRISRSGSLTLTSIVKWAPYFESLGNRRT